MPDIDDLRRREFDARLQVKALRRAVFEENRTDQMDALFAAEAELAELNDARARAEKKDPRASAQLMGGGGGGEGEEGDDTLGQETTGLEAKARLRLAQVPTSLIHLFDAVTYPLVAFEIQNFNNETKRLCFTTYVEGYSAHAIDTIEVKKGTPAPVHQLPTFFPDRLQAVTELTRATVNVEVRDLDAKTELQMTMPIWLLARSTAPLAVLDPGSGTWKDMTPFLGAYVTPNAPSVMKFLRLVTDAHPQRRLIGYQEPKSEVETQVKAVFETLKNHGIRYVNSVIDFTPENGSQNQRVRTPRETLDDREANCIDGTLVVASLLEAISLNPAIVIIPGHAFVAWETWRRGSEASNEWRYLETTMISSHTFEEACQSADQLAARWSAKAKAEGKPAMFKRLALRELRAKSITPLE